MGKKYKICPYCGSHLDFGEKCDCRADAAATKRAKETENPDGERKINAGRYADWVTKLFEEEREEDREDRP